MHQFFIDAFIGEVNFAVELTKITATILLDAVVAVKEYLTVTSKVQTAIENNFELLVGFATVEEADFCVGDLASFDLATFECTCESGFVLRGLETQIQSCDVEISFVEVVMIEFLGTLSKYFLTHDSLVVHVASLRFRYFGNRFSNC